MKRRNFLQCSAAAGIAAACSWWPKSGLAQSTARLPIPPVLQPDAHGNVQLTVQAGKTQWRPGAATTTWGLNGPLLGPCLQLQRGQKVTISVHNTLAEATTTHWHGLEVPGVADGGPQAVVAPGASWQARFTIDQPAATCWYHPHTHGRTGYQVAMGLGGMMVLEDELSHSLPLPKTWGVDDIPLVLQDKRLNASGQIDYQLDVMSAAVGWFGDMMLSNGVVFPTHTAPQGWLRIRVLNGCNARSLLLATSDKRPMYVIASDGGFLPQPVQLTQLPLFMGERFEILVEVREGAPFDLCTLPVQQMGMTVAPFNRAVPVLRVVAANDAAKGRLPDDLCPLPALSSFKVLRSRSLILAMDHRLDMQGMRELVARYGEQAMAGMGHGHMGGMMHGNGKKNNDMGHGVTTDQDMHSKKGAMHGRPKPLDLYTANTINGEAFAMDKPSFDVPLGQCERWMIISKGDMMLHPFHIHGAQFRILKENGKEPAPHRRGWKDIVVVENSVSEVLVTFRHPAPAERAYMAHCHLLEHEDTGMMLSFTVSS